MSEEVKSFIDKLAQNDMVGAGDSFKDALRSKVGDALDNRRQEVAGNMFKAEPHSDPKPDVQGTGTFTQDGQVEPTGREAQVETQPETPEVSNAESQPVSTEPTDVQQ